MKFCLNIHRIISVICLYACCLSPLQAADLPGGWKQRESPVQRMLFAGDFHDVSTGWAVGIDVIELTVNGGERWISRYKPNPKQAYWFTSVAAINEKSALVCGYPYASNDPQTPGILLLTEDQGMTWKPIACGSREAKYSSMVFADNRRVGYLLSDRDGLMRTTNSGRTWRRVSIATEAPRTHMVQHSAIALPDEHSVIVVGNGHLAISKNNGVTWQHRPLPQNVKHPHGWLCVWVCFPTADEGWIYFYGGDRIHTRDGGLTWEVDGEGTLWHQEGQSLWKTTRYDVAYSDDLGKTWSDPVRVGGGQDGIECLEFTDKQVHAIGGSEGDGRGFLADRLLKQQDNPVTLPDGVVPIALDLPDDGLVTVQILDQQDNVVRNLINGMPLPKGKTTIKWDLSTENHFWPPFLKSSPHLYDPPATVAKSVPPGQYRWRGLFHTGLHTEYRFDYYPIKKHGMPWVTEDGTGAWLGDHSPPQCLVAYGDRMWVGSFAEGGYALLESDLSMRKQWGVNRIELTTPRALAAEGPYIYFVEAGGWDRGLRLIQVHHQSKQSRKLFQAARNENQPRDIAGLAVKNNLAYITFRDGDHLLVVDLKPNIQGKDQAMHVVAKIPAQRAGNIRPYLQDQLALVVDQTVSLLDTTHRILTPVVRQLENPFGLGIDKQGNFYVGEMKPLHQVHVFNPQGRRLRVIGQPGGHPVGPFNKQRMESPRGVEVDANGNVWVTEYNDELKRTSVWNSNGRCINQVLGPPVYGGGGSIDPTNVNRLFYRGKEFKRTPATGKVELVNIIWRMDDPTVDELVGEGRAHNFGGNAPSMPFYKNGKLWFRLWGAYGMGEISVLFVYDQNRVRPVSAVGQTPDWIKDRFNLPNSPHNKAFAWTDDNNDGKVQQHEVQFGKVSGNATWGVRMNENFQVAFSTQVGDVGFCFFEPRTFNRHGYPVYQLPTEFKMVADLTIHDPCQVQGMMTDAKGNAVAISPYIISVSPQGKVNWRYICRWPGLHAGLASTAMGMEPGVLIAPLRFYGSAMTPQLGEVLCMGTNYGLTDLMTADGMYIGQVFGNSRRSDAWRYNQPPKSKQLEHVSLGQEHFGGSFQKVRQPDGKDQYLYVVSPGSPHCSVIELIGLEQIKQLAGDSFTVTPEHVREAEALKQQQLKEQLVPREYTLSKLDRCNIDGKDTEWPNDQITGFKLGYDAQNLYVYYAGQDNRAVFANVATRSNFAECFKSGDVVDVMLQTHPTADANRTQAAQGDIRLSLTMLDGQPAAVLYDYVVPGTPESQAMSFSSPWRSVRVDRVRIVQNATIKVTREHNRFTLEAAIPLSAIGLRPRSGLRLQGDVGRVLSDQTGTTRIDRIYWSNPNTRVVSDVPSETQLQPNLWGTFVFE